MLGAFRENTVLLNRAFSPVILVPGELIVITPLSVKLPVNSIIPPPYSDFNTPFSSKYVLKLSLVIV